MRDVCITSLCEDPGYSKDNKPFSLPSALNGKGKRLLVGDYHGMLKVVDHEDVYELHHQRVSIYYSLTVGITLFQF